MLARGRGQRAARGPAGWAQGHAQSRVLQPRDRLLPPQCQASLCHGREKKKSRAGSGRPQSPPPQGCSGFSPRCLCSFPGRSDPPSLTPRGEMSAGFAGHPAAPSPPGCTVRPKADKRRGAACSRATSEWLSSVTRDISPGVTRGGQQQAAEGQSSPKNTHLRASVFVAASLCDTHAGS